ARDRPVRRLDGDRRGFPGLLLEGDLERLEPATSLPRGFEAELPEARLDVARGAVRPRRPRPSPLEGVVGEELDVGEETGGGDRGDVAAREESGEEEGRHGEGPEARPVYGPRPGGTWDGEVRLPIFQARWAPRGSPSPTAWGSSSPSSPPPSTSRDPSS